MNPYAVYTVADANGKKIVEDWGSLTWPARISATPKG